MLVQFQEKAVRQQLAFDLISTERGHQDEAHGITDHYPPLMWVVILIIWVGKLGFDVLKGASIEQLQHRFVQVAAIGTAAIELGWGSSEQRDEEPEDDEPADNVVSLRSTVQEALDRR